MTHNRCEDAKPAIDELIAQRIRESVAVKNQLLEDTRTIKRIAELLITIFHKGNKILLFGNGGSAADAQHIAAELVGKFYNNSRPALPALALTVNTSSLTAIANDYEYAEVFARQVEALGQPGDVAIGISTSGNSENVIRGVRMARKKSLITVAFTGVEGGRLKDEVDYCLSVPSKDTLRIQEAHILVGHILCEIIEKELFGDRTLNDMEIVR